MGTCLPAWLRVPFSRTAVPMAKKLRPAIDPIGSFPDLLARLDAAFAKHRP